MESNYYSDYIVVAPVAFGVVDLLKSRLLFSSKMAKEMLGYSNQEISELMRNDFKEFIHEDDMAQHAAYFEKLKKSKLGDIVESTHRLKAKSGAYVWVHIKDKVVEVTEEGVASKFVFAAQDVSKVKQLEAQLKEQMFRLSEISHRNAHDLKAPISSVLELLDLMEREKSKGNTNEVLLHYLRVTLEKLEKVIDTISGITEPT